jgi:aminobenzoyl-glutamate utilization protein B
MDKYRPEMQKYYYDASKYPTYLEQLGIHYPTVRTSSTPAAPAPTGEEIEDGGMLQQ